METTGKFQFRYSRRGGWMLFVETAFYLGGQRFTFWRPAMSEDIADLFGPEVIDGCVL